MLPRPEIRHWRRPCEFCRRGSAIVWPPRFGSEVRPVARPAPAIDKAEARSQRDEPRIAPHRASFRQEQELRAVKRADVRTQETVGLGEGIVYQAMGNAAISRRRNQVSAAYRDANDAADASLLRLRTSFLERRGRLNVWPNNVWTID